MKKNWFTKLIASVLCLTMVVQIPMQAGAAPQQTVQQEEEGAPDSPVIAEEIDEEEAWMYVDQQFLKVSKGGI